MKAVTHSKNARSEIFSHFHFFCQRVGFTPLFLFAIDLPYVPMATKSDSPQVWVGGLKKLLQPKKFDPLKICTQKHILPMFSTSLQD